MKITSGEIFRIINKETSEQEGVYQRGNYDQFDFHSIESARSSNCHDTYKDKVKYGINKYRVTIELIEEDIDPASEEENHKAERKEKLEKEMDGLGIVNIFDRLRFIVSRDILNGS